MIALLSGLVVAADADGAVIDAGGVGYLAFCSSRTLGKLTVGQPARLEIVTHVREDHIHLYGFFDVAEKRAFNALMTVQGVGAKVALAILSALPPERLAQAAAAQDRAAIAVANGVGPKLAGRIVAELKDKLGLLTPTLANLRQADPAGSASGLAGDRADPAIADAVSALVNLGYQRIEAHNAALRAAADGEAETSGLIKAALRLLAEAMDRPQRAVP